MLGSDCDCRELRWLGVGVNGRRECDKVCSDSAGREEESPSVYVSMYKNMRSWVCTLHAQGQPWLLGQWRKLEASSGVCSVVTKTSGSGPRHTWAQIHSLYLLRAREVEFPCLQHGEIVRSRGPVSQIFSTALTHNECTAYTKSYLVIALQLCDPHSLGSWD